jgi:hypothetical protein
MPDQQDDHPEPKQYDGRVVAQPQIQLLIQIAAIVVDLTFYTVMNRLAPPDASEDDSDREEVDHHDVGDDYEGSFHIINGYICKLRTQQHAPGQNTSSWEKLGERHHQSLESIAGPRANCRTCYPCPSTSYSWYVCADPILSPSVSERSIS